MHHRYLSPLLHPVRCHHAPRRAAVASAQVGAAPAEDPQRAPVVVDLLGQPWRDVIRGEHAQVLRREGGVHEVGAHVVARVARHDAVDLLERRAAPLAHLGAQVPEVLVAELHLRAPPRGVAALVRHLERLRHEGRHQVVAVDHRLLAAAEALADQRHRRAPELGQHHRPHEHEGVVVHACHSVLRGAPTEGGRKAKAGRYFFAPVLKRRRCSLVDLVLTGGGAGPILLPKQSPRRARARSQSTRTRGSRTG
jgi:hypothetical protein